MFFCKRKYSRADVSWTPSLPPWLVYTPATSQDGQGKLVARPLPEHESDTTYKYTMTWTDASDGRVESFEFEMKVKAPPCKYLMEKVKLKIPPEIETNSVHSWNISENFDYIMRLTMAVMAVILSVTSLKGCREMRFKTKIKSIITQFLLSTYI